MYLRSAQDPPKGDKCASGYTSSRGWPRGCAVFVHAEYLVQGSAFPISSESRAIARSLDDYTNILSVFVQSIPGRY